MKSYHQYCALARGLDVLGDRWTLLIVRELLMRDCRYTDLRAGLPGIATNLLADRLKALEAAGVVESVTVPAPTTAVYRLTAEGRRLEPVVNELARWSVSRMPDPDPAPEDEIRGHWLLTAVRARFEHAELSAVPARVLVFDDGELGIWLEIDAGRLAASGLGPPPKPADLVIGGSAEAALEALMRSAGAASTGDDASLLLSVLGAGRPVG